ncbi:MAG: hypothetical protein U0105_25510 [Candidatus Obscuribacterales bacterium]
MLKLLNRLSAAALVLVSTSPVATAIDYQEIQGYHVPTNLIRRIRVERAANINAAPAVPKSNCPTCDDVETVSDPSVAAPSRQPAKPRAAVRKPKPKPRRPSAIPKFPSGNLGAEPPPGMKQRRTPGYSRRPAKRKPTFPSGKLPAGPSSPLPRFKKPIPAQISVGRNLSCEEALAAARQAVNEENGDKAASILRKALSANPECSSVKNELVQVSIMRARQFMCCGYFECGARRAREALYLDPTNPAAASILKEAYSKSGVEPSNPDNRMNIAECLANHGRYIGALVEYQQAAQLVPSALALAGEGNMYTALNRLPEAESAYQHSLWLDPHNGDTWRRRGLLNLKSNKITQAAQYLAQASILNGEDQLASSSLLDLANKQVAKVPSAQNVLTLAKAYLLHGDEKSALSLYNQPRLAPALVPTYSAPEDWAVWVSEQRNNIVQERVAAVEGHVLKSNPVDAFTQVGPALETKNVIVKNCGCAADRLLGKPAAATGSGAPLTAVTNSALAQTAPPELPINFEEGDQLY